MHSLKFPWDADSPVRILCLGAHSDDIEIGCGGTVLKLSAQFPNAVFYWVVFSAPGVRAEEAQKAARLFAGKNALQGPVIKDFRDGFMPFCGADIKEVFEELKNVNPDLVFTHNRDDAHQDHRILSELTWNTFRDHLILEYEIPKYDGDFGRPSVFVPLDSDVCKKKVQYLMDAFVSQQTKHWFQPDMFFSLLRLRGMECNAPSGNAEAFYSRKLTL